jgi:hypothetical protein
MLLWSYRDDGEGTSRGARCYVVHVPDFHPMQNLAYNAPDNSEDPDKLISQPYDGWHRPQRLIAGLVRRVVSSHGQYALWRETEGQILHHHVWTTR